MRSNKKLIIVISIVVALAVAGAAFAYLFLMTDLFKSKEELFMKYFAQNVESFQKITDLKTVDVYENLKNENKYESNTNIEIVHSEGGEVSDPLNNLTAKLEVQKNNEEQYFYADGQILYDDEEYLEAEIIKEEELYGIRFTDAVKQFVTVKNNGNLGTVGNKIGVEKTQLQQIMDSIDRNSIISDSQGEALKNKYLDIITKNIMQGSFGKQKNAMITYNNVTTETNAYTVLLSSDQIRNMLIEILNNAKNETEILEKLPVSIDIDKAINLVNQELQVPTVKITVYEQKQQTIRTVAEIGLYRITIENSTQNGETKTAINYINNSEAIQTDIEIAKQNTDNQENVAVAIRVTDGEKENIITLSNQMQLLNNEIELNTQISHKEDITTMSIILENNITMGNNFEKMQTLSSANNIILTDIQEERMEAIVEVLQREVPKTTNERIKLLSQKFGLNNEETVEPGDNETGDQTSQVEINKFNSKFEFYTGDEVSAENVRMLLDIVKNYLASYENIEEQPQQNIENLVPVEKKVNIKLKIEKDVLNEKAINEILPKINDSAKYKISIIYKEENGLIDYITITEK